MTSISSSVCLESKCNPKRTRVPSPSVYVVDFVRLDSHNVFLLTSFSCRLQVKNFCFYFVICEAHEVLWLKCETNIRVRTIPQSISTYRCYLRGKLEEIIIRWKTKMECVSFFGGVFKSQCTHCSCDPHN